MAILVLCNIGARDVMWDDQEIRPAREGGERLLRELEQDPGQATRLRFPILEPCLRHLLTRHPQGRDDPPWQVILFGTDQPDPHHRPSDTLYFAELIAHHLPDRLNGLRAKFEAQRITGINPSLYDEAYEAFGRLLPERPEGFSWVYVILAGGTPACNMGLLLQALRRYRERLRVLYLPYGGEPHELRIGQQLIQAFREETARDRLMEMDFARAEALLRELGAHPGLIALAAYAARRAEFDFQGAQEALDQAIREGDREIRAFIDRRLRHDLDPLFQSGDPRRRWEALLRELFWNARAAYRSRRYADFLGRVYRFQEAVLRFLVEDLLCLPTDLAPHVREETLQRWEKEIRDNPALLEFLESQKVEGKPLDWRQIARPTYKALLAFAIEHGGRHPDGRPMVPERDRDRYRELLRRVNQLDPLVELRHRTIIGHDFVGVSEEDLRRRYAPRENEKVLDPVEGLGRILKLLHIDLRDDPYAAIAAFIQDRLSGDMAGPGSAR
ncbi:hypothetical protein HRbin22_00515 [Candidatus Thermoflexus japonica]|uniref:Uncharacterized protein n=1 Tax=Candidatus Thermoflexus japonica TaxID=2035417 RepID=A0A2H5Y4F2_9CHLR|nr:hypothetical protein HRbin22_00515 [Candidatus Thermoflexus japonica]